MNRKRIAFLLLTFGVVCGMVLQVIRRTPDGCDAGRLSDDQLRKLAQALGLYLPPRTSRVEVFLDVEDELASLLLKCTFDSADVASSKQATWLWADSRSSSLGFEQEPVIRPKWYDAGIIRPGDMRFVKEYNHKRSSSRVYGLLRIQGSAAVLYLDGLVEESMIPDSVLAAFERNPDDIPNPVFGPSGQFYVACWQGQGIKMPGPPAIQNAPESLLDGVRFENGFLTNPDDLGYTYNVFGEIRSCLLQQGARHPSRLGSPDGIDLAMRGYVVIGEEDVQRLIECYDWSDLPASEFHPAPMPDAPSMSSKLLRSEELVEVLRGGCPVPSPGIVVMDPDNGVIYLEISVPVGVELEDPTEFSHDANE